METIIAKPVNKQQLAALKAVMKVLKIDFTVEKDFYNPDFLAKVERADKQIKAGIYRKTSSSEI